MSEEVVKPEIKFKTVKNGEAYYHKASGIVVIHEDFDERYCRGSKALRRDGKYYPEHEPVWIAKSSLVSMQ